MFIKNVQDLIKELQKLDPNAPIKLKDFDENWYFTIYKVEYNNGTCEIILDEEYE
jgi:hypothetical protein